jgi:hypothetical protein
MVKLRIVRGLFRGRVVFQRRTVLGCDGGFGGGEVEEDVFEGGLLTAEFVEFEPSANESEYIRAPRLRSASALTRRRW